MNRNFEKVRKYYDDYDELKDQVKKHVYRILYTDREHLKKKNCFNERRCANKLYQQHFDKKMIFARCR